MLFKQTRQDEVIGQFPAFIISVDTEGDNLWSQPTQITTRNANFLHRFQTLCETYAFKPTYLVNYEMALCPVFREFGADVLKRKVAEIGMHLHAWNTPPVVPLTANDFHFQPYLIEYPLDLMAAKITYMTDLLEDTFGAKMVSHRAGRWAFNEHYARILVDKGYQIDSSVTPYYSWKQYPGDPQRRSGTDYTNFPHDAYFLNPDDISRSGSSPLLEVPTSIVPVIKCAGIRHKKVLSAVMRVFDKVVPPRWLRVRPNNLRDMLYVIRRANRDGRKYLQYCLHSSELMPGGSPKFRTQSDIDNLYHDMQTVFEQLKDRYRGATMKEFHSTFSTYQSIG